MKCPDCKIEMIEITTMGDTGLREIECEPYWKCPRCKIEIDEEDEGGYSKAVIRRRGL